MTQVVRKEHHVVTVVSGLVSSNSTSTAINIPDANHGWWFILDITAVDTLTTLDVAVQTLYDGTNFGDIVAFEQQTGVAKTSEKVTFAANIALGFDPSAALAAGTFRSVMGDAIRASWTIVGTSATFTVFGVPM